MPLSWLPLISDYTSVAQRPVPTSGISAIVYGLTSCWMAFIGLGAALLTHTINIATIILRAGFGNCWFIYHYFFHNHNDIYGRLFCWCFFKTIFSKMVGNNGRNWCNNLGTISALICPMDNFSNFLYLIGSVFAPMIAIQITDYFIFGSRLSSTKLPMD